MQTLRKPITVSMTALFVAYTSAYVGDSVPDMTMQLLAHSPWARKLLQPHGMVPTQLWQGGTLGLRAALLGFHALGFGVAITLGLRWGRQLFVPTNRAGRGQVPVRTSTLVLFLSPPREVAPPAHMLAGCHLAGEKAPTITAPPIPLDVALAHLAAGKQHDHHKRLSATGKPFGYWAWEQPLRGMWHHLADGGPLARVILCCSPETMPLAPQFIRCLTYHFGTTFSAVEFLAIASQPLPDQPFSLLNLRADEVNLLDRDQLSRQGVEFEDHDALVSALLWLLDSLATRGIPPQDITIDCTSGPKPTSIAAASMSFNRNVQVQYIPSWPDRGKDTDAPWTYTPRAYAFHFDTQLKPEFL